MATRRRSDDLVLGCDLAATLLFAIEGAAAGVAAHLDVFGVIVCGFVTAVGGGIIRDVLLGDHRRRRCATRATSCSHSGAACSPSSSRSWCESSPATWAERRSTRAALGLGSRCPASAKALRFATSPTAGRCSTRSRGRLRAPRRRAARACRGRAGSSRCGDASAYVRFATRDAALLELMSPASTAKTLAFGTSPLERAFGMLLG